MNEVNPSLGILSSMITPAVLILACGSLITTTSQRLSRVIDRVRKISQEFMQIEKHSFNDPAIDNKRRILYTLLQKSVRRSRMLTHVMTLLYLSLALFVATSLSIGVVAVTHLKYTWIPTAFGVVGAIILFISSAILIIESQLTYSVIADELDFVIESSKQIAPKEVDEAKSLSWRKLFRKKGG
jgi:hypothetical protein